LAARGVDWQKCATSVAGVRPAWLLAAAGANLAAAAVGGLRWRAVARPNAVLSKTDAVEIFFVGNFTNLIVVRLGDLVRAVLTARLGKAEVGRVLGGLIVERAADGLMLLLLAVGLSWLVRFPAVVRAGVVLLGIVAGGAVLTLWFAAGWMGAIVSRVISWVSQPLAVRIAEMVDGLAVGVRSSAGSGCLAVTIALSAVIWVLSGLSMTFTIAAFDLPVPWFAGLFVMLVINLGGVIPASPGAIGVYHYLAVLALSVWMADPSAPLAFAVVSHAMGLVLTALLGTFGFVRQGVTLRGLSPVTWAAARG
jgi:uncharacterized protein (TIRG00374 family)